MKKLVGHACFPVVVLSVLGLVVRWWASSLGVSFESDVLAFQRWAVELYENGLAAFYTNGSFKDYPPLYMYLLYAVGWVRAGFDWDYLSLAFNRAVFVPAMLGDIMAGALIYLFCVKRDLSKHRAAWVSAAWVFNPVVIFNSSVWGQIDAVFAVFLLASLLLLANKRLYAAYFVYALALLFNPRCLYVLPVFAYYTFAHLRESKYTFEVLVRTALCAVACAALMVAALLPFTQGFDLSSVLFEYYRVMEAYPFATLHAYNFYALIGGNFKFLGATYMGLSYSTWGAWATGLIMAGSFIFLHRDKERKHTFFVASTLLLMVFIFSVKMREWYIYPALLLLLMACVQSKYKQAWLLYAGFSVTAFVNSLGVFRAYNIDLNLAFILKTMPVFSFINVLLALVMLFMLGRLLFPVSQARQNESVAAHPPRMLKRDYAFILLLTVVYAFIAFFRLGDVQAPQSAWSPAPGETALIDLGEVTDVDTFRFMLGIRHVRTFALYGSEDNQNWTFEHVHDGQNAFAWEEIPVHTRARYFHLVPQDGDNPRLDLLEAVFLDARGEVIPVADHSPQAAALFDEPHLVPDRACYMNSMYFDEIFHARTGYEFVHRLPVNEYTHPPLGKSMMALSIRALGMTPFAWRLPGALLGVLMLPLIYAMARQLFNSNNWALFAAVIFTFDFMHFAQTRIATIDTYVVFFVMAMYLFMLLYIKRGKTGFLCLCGLCMGLAIASKWQGVYGALGLPLLFFPVWYEAFKQNRREAVKTLAGCFAWFVFIPLLVYTLSYIPFVHAVSTAGYVRDQAAVPQGGGLLHGLRLIGHNQIEMWQYHSSFAMGHPFSSAWWEWPFMLQPLLFERYIVSDGVRQGISTFGNPAVWWMGIVAVLYAVYAWCKKRDYALTFLLIAFAAQYVPWMLVSRTTFIYHYFPSVPFVVLMVTYFFRHVPAKNTRWACAYGVLVVALFALFYPILSGLPISADFVRVFLQWLPMWEFV